VSKHRIETTGFGYTNIIEATQDVEGLTYSPWMTETCETYELILLSVHQALGDKVQDIVRSAANKILESLKSESMKDFNKKKGIKEVIGSISNELFSQLVNLSKITDYMTEDDVDVDPDIK